MDNVKVTYEQERALDAAYNVALEVLRGRVLARVGDAELVASPDDLSGEGSFLGYATQAEMDEFTAANDRARADIFGSPGP